jgi:hypothetical protein
MTFKSILNANLGFLDSREETLNRLLVEESSNHIFSNIYMPAAQTDSLGYDKDKNIIKFQLLNSKMGVCFFKTKDHLTPLWT